MYYEGSSLFKHSFSSPCPPALPSLDPDDPQSYEWGFGKFLSLFRYPAVEASLLAIAFFFLIVFSTNVILIGRKITSLGITLTISILAFVSLVVLVLFII